MKKLAYTVNEAVELGAGSRSALYEAMAAGRLVGRKQGKKTIILHDDLVAYLEDTPIFSDVEPTGGNYRKHPK